jgi:hypothetical protein
MVSAEELFKDRKIIIREKFLNISRFSYLLSKINFLIVLSAIQSLLFVFVSAVVLDIRGMFWQQWLVLFTTACYGNVIGLNISAGMRTVVSIYILVPLILVPQLLLGGAMIKFDDLHKSITNKEYVPVLGDLMATRWAYEAIMVEGFKSNRYIKPTFDQQLEIEQNNYYKDQLIKNLRNEVINYILQRKDIKGEKEKILNKLEILKYHINELSRVTGIVSGNLASSLNYNDFNQRIADSVNRFFDEVYKYLIEENTRYFSEKVDIENEIQKQYSGKGLTLLATAYDNQRLDDIVLNQVTINEGPYYELPGRWVQKSTPIFMKPTSRSGRAHFFAPYKQIGNTKVDTIVFNVISMWILIIILFIALYFNLLKRFINYLESMRLPFWRKFGRTALITR